MLAGCIYTRFDASLFQNVFKKKRNKEAKKKQQSATKCPIKTTKPGNREDGFFMDVYY